jgi:hypothetical protein
MCYARVHEIRHAVTAVSRVISVYVWLGMVFSFVRGLDTDTLWWRDWWRLCLILVEKILLQWTIAFLSDSVVGQFCCIFIFLHLKLQFALSNNIYTVLVVDNDLIQWHVTVREDIALENRSIDISLHFPKQYFSGYVALM